MASLRRPVNRLIRNARELYHDNARHDKTQQAHQQAGPMPARDEKEPSQNGARSQQGTAEDPKCRLLGRNTPANRPPKAAEENRTEQNAGQQGQRQTESLIY